ncbi:MAG: FlgD immunoglobulin-like domain containing protein, partial [bacterium]
YFEGKYGNISKDPLFCDPDDGDFTLAALSDCLPAYNTCGVLIGALDQGCDEPTGIGDITQIRISELSLDQNHPNPFNPSTAISFTLPRREKTNLSIYDVEGKLVTTLVDETLDAGLNEVIWYGKDARGNPASAGVYFYRLSAGRRTLTKKMVLLK